MEPIRIPRCYTPSRARPTHHLPGANAGGTGDHYDLDSLYRTVNVKAGVADSVAEYQNPGSQTVASTTGVTYDAAQSRSQVTQNPHAPSKPNTRRLVDAYLSQSISVSKLPPPHLREVTSATRTCAAEPRLCLAVAIGCGRRIAKMITQA